MKWILRYGAIMVYVWGVVGSHSCVGEYGPRVVQYGSAEAVLARIMSAWKVVTVGHSIAPDCRRYLNDQLFDELLLLNNSLWRAIYGVSAYDHAVITELLGTFCYSCEEFCYIQDEQQVYHIRRMVGNMREMWRERACL